MGVHRVHGVKVRLAQKAGIHQECLQKLPPEGLEFLLCRGHLRMMLLYVVNQPLPLRWRDAHHVEHRLVLRVAIQRVQRQHVLVQQLLVPGPQAHPLKTGRQALSGDGPVGVRQIFREDGECTTRSEVLHQRIGAHVLAEGYRSVAGGLPDAGIYGLSRGGVVDVPGDQRLQLLADAAPPGARFALVHDGRANALVHRGIQPDAQLPGGVVDGLLQPLLTKPRLELIHKGVSCKLARQRFILHVPPAKLRKGFARQLRRVVAGGEDRVKVADHVLRACHAQAVGQMMEHLVHGDGVIARLSGPYGDVPGPGLIVALHGPGHTVHAPGAHGVSNAKRLHQVLGNPARAALGRPSGNRRSTLLLLRGASLIEF